MSRLFTILLVTLTLVGCGAEPAVPTTPPTAQSNDSAPRSTASSDDASKPDGTATKPMLTSEQSEFSNKWKAASEDERRQMADLARVYPLFDGATKAQVKYACGPATKTGIDKFGDDVIRYELGAVPEAGGGGQYHPTFVFENDKVVRIMGNFATISP